VYSGGGTTFLLQFFATLKVPGNFGATSVHYTCRVRARTVSTFYDPYYLLHPAQKRNLGGHQFKDAGYLIQLVTRWLITQDTGCWQQGTENLDTTKVLDFLEAQYGKPSCGLSRESEVARFLGMRVRISPGAWIPVSSERCLRRADHSSRGVQCECDREASIMRRPWPK